VSVKVQRPFLYPCIHYVCWCPVLTQTCEPLRIVRIITDFGPKLWLRYYGGTESLWKIRFSGRRWYKYGEPLKNTIFLENGDIFVFLHAFFLKVNKIIMNASSAFFLSIPQTIKHLPGSFPTRRTPLRDSVSPTELLA
jgi:hypothetical protein